MLMLGSLSLLAMTGVMLGAATPPADPGRFAQVAKVDDQYQAYNVEMVEVVGGRFWAPYPKPGEARPSRQPAAAAASISPPSCSASASRST